MFNKALLTQASQLLELLRKKGLKIATAESCTGGLIAALLTEIPGSSDVMERGFVTYSNLAKQQMLGVDEALIKTKGAVSAEVAEAMAKGAIAHSAADIAVAVTGVAGPGGGSVQKPVGLVFIAAASREMAPIVTKHHFSGTRVQIRLSAVEHVIAALIQIVT